MKKIYAGIGARKTPDDVMKIMTELATKLELLGFKLRSGGADGADKAFAAGVKNRANKEIFIPWRGFNSLDTIYDSPTEKAMRIAESFHPKWNALGEGGKKLQGRNSHIVLGENCDDPVDFIICWTETGGITGGTGQGLRIAKRYNIPVFNLKNEVDIQKLHKLLNELIEKANSK